MIFYAVYVHFQNHSREFLFLKPAFDIQAWATSRQDAFRILGVVKISYEEVKIDAA